MKSKEKKSIKKALLGIFFFYGILLSIQTYAEQIDATTAATLMFNTDYISIKQKKPGLGNGSFNTDITPDNFGNGLTTGESEYQFTFIPNFNFGVRNVMAKKTIEGSKMMGYTRYDSTTGGNPRYYMPYFFTIQDIREDSPGYKVKLALSEFTAVKSGHQLVGAKVGFNGVSLYADENSIKNPSIDEVPQGNPTSMYTDLPDGTLHYFSPGISEEMVSVGPSDANKATVSGESGKYYHGRTYVVFDKNYTKDVEEIKDEHGEIPIDSGLFLELPAYAGSEELGDYKADMIWSIESTP